jgi:hypothetical protein
MHIAILDDYQKLAVQLAGCRSCSKSSALADFDVVCLMRERTVSKELIGGGGLG